MNRIIPVRDDGAGLHEVPEEQADLWLLEDESGQTLGVYDSRLDAENARDKGSSC